jgi:hypothetical protein
MHDAGKTASKEWNPFSGLHSLCAINTTLGSSLESFLRHGTVYDRKVDAGLLPDSAAGEDTRNTSTTVRSYPSIRSKLSFAIKIFNGLADFTL